MLTSVGPGRSGDGPTVVLLHGWGSDEQDLAGLAPYLPPGLGWASVRAPERHPEYGYAWYQLDSPASWDAQGPIAQATVDLWEWVDATLGAQAAVIPVGFSQGGLMASQLLRTRPARVTAAAILSGYVRTGVEAADAELAQLQRPVFWGRGSEDPVIPEAGVTETEFFLVGHSALERRVYPGLGHSVSEPELYQLREFLDRVAWA